jgi:hypothetical protein
MIRLPRQEQIAHNKSMAPQSKAGATVNLGRRERNCSLDVADCIFLFVAMLLSAEPYLRGLGFYSDDWSYQATLVPVSGGGLIAIFKALLASDPDLLVRPVQAAVLALEFRAFGRHPLPYHIVCTAILGIVTILLYIALKELRAGRSLALSIALVFGLLPHYSTDRIWISSQQAMFCMAFALLGIYGLLRSVRPGVRRPGAWVALGALALVLSFLSYEVAAGLIIASLGVLGWRRYQQIRNAPERSLKSMAGLASVTALLLVVGIVKSHLQTRFYYQHHPLRFLGRLGGLFVHSLAQAVQFNFWTYVLHMPAVIFDLYRRAALSTSAVVVATIITFSATAYLWKFMESSTIPSSGLCLWLVLLGFVLFGLGYVLFFRDMNTDFSVAGLNNRITIASSLGASFVLVAIAGLASSVLRPDLARARAFSVLMGLICGLNCLAVSGIGYFWEEARSQQEAILQSVAANVRTLPKGSALLLDGFCRYTGPGVAFETNWDATGAMQLTLEDYSLVSDVVSPNLHFDEGAADTTMYGIAEGHYPYNSGLFVYNLRNKTLTSLPSQEAATSYLRTMNPTGDSGCPAAHEGIGEKIF